MAERPLRVMADSNILIAGVLKPRWFFEFLGHAMRGDFQLVLAPQTVAEVAVGGKEGWLPAKRAGVLSGHMPV